MQALRTLDSLRRSMDGSKCVLVWDAGTQPAGVAVMDHAAILAVMATPEWTMPEEP